MMPFDHFYLRIDSKQGSTVQEIPCTLDDAADQEAGRDLAIQLIRSAYISLLHLIASKYKQVPW